MILGFLGFSSIFARSSEILRCTVSFETLPFSLFRQTLFINSSMLKTESGLVTKTNKRLQRPGDKKIVHFFQILVIQPLDLPAFFLYKRRLKSGSHMTCLFFFKKC